MHEISLFCCNQIVKSLVSHVESYSCVYKTGMLEVSVYTKAYLIY